MPSPVPYGRCGDAWRRRNTNELNGGVTHAEAGQADVREDDSERAAFCRRPFVAPQRQWEACSQRRFALVRVHTVDSECDRRISWLQANL
jgi:hypothetical protein